MQTSILVGTALAFLLAGCGLVRQQEMRARSEALHAQSSAAIQECDAKLPKGNPKTAASRAQCVNAAVIILRPIVPFPDLMDLYVTTNMAIAERVQKGQITIAQANEELARKSTEIASEEQRRIVYPSRHGARRYGCGKHAIRRAAFMHKNWQYGELLLRDIVRGTLMGSPRDHSVAR